ncbi:cytochrome P450 [Truncatella angustata]|uniref:Cytochrome P450 n=1 Tax=Truncatella angustata TaxID=152316 RepID=A0A9P9A3M5_9PEZI|nr:cytochrome P450 [Truncatella angustata]KAH6660632.1 cytochrome P450 [Truncatella angustata]
MAIEALMRTAKERFVDHLIQSTFLSIVIAFVSYLIYNEAVRSGARVPGMRGPRGWPLIGNLWDIRSNAAEKYEDWSKTYGDVYQVQMGNVPVVVVNSAAAAKTLWVSHSQALSSRPTTYTFHKIASSTAGLTIGTSPYDESLRRRKKGAAVALNRPALQSYVPYLDMESKTFIEDLFTYGKAGRTPIDPLPLIQRLSLSLAMTINWGVRVPSHEDRLFKEIVEVEEELNRFRSTTGNIQDYVPLLRLNPINKTSAKAREMRDRRDHYLRTLNNELSEKVAMGTNKPCIQANIIKFKEEKISDVELISISLSVLGGGFETVSNTVQFSMAFLAQHPDIQDKAYEAINDFQRSDEPLCDAADDQKCAYINGLAKEALRYFTVIPLNLPRQSIKDIEYNGVLIPEGTTFYMNAMACNYDHELWDDPQQFRPERWIEKPDAPVFTFGLGYRMCAGHLLASRELYLVFIRLLSSFRLELHGQVDTNPRTGMKNPRDLIMAPKKYEIFCVPRNEDLLRQVLEGHKVEECCPAVNIAF